VIPIFVVAAIVVVVAIVIVISRPPRRDDDIDTFRRQIDALSKESRRPTIDRMNPSDGSPADDDGPDEPETER